MATYKIKDIQEIFDLIKKGSIEKVIVPSKNVAFALNRRFLDSAEKQSQLEGKFVTCSDYLAARIPPIYPKLDKASRRLIIYRAIKSIKAAYFRSPSRGVVDAISSAISQLKMNRITPRELELIASTRGSKKEYDLLCVYKKYEELLAEKNLFDDESIYLTNFLPHKNELSKTATFGFEITPPVIEHFFAGANKLELEKDFKPHSRLVACNSPTDEARFVINEVATSLANGLQANEINVVLQNNGFLKQVLLALKEEGLIDSGLHFFDPKTSSAYFAIAKADYPNEAAPMSRFAELALASLAKHYDKYCSNLSIKDNRRLAARSLADADKLKLVLEKLMIEMPVSRDEFFSLFDQLIDAPFVDETKLPFKVVNIFDAAITNNKHVIIAQCNDGIIPAQQGHLRFFQEADTLSPAVDKRIDKIFLPADEQLKIELKYFQIAAAGATLSFSLHSSEGSETAISPFINADKIDFFKPQREAEIKKPRILGSDFTDKETIKELQKNIRTRRNDDSAHRPFSITRLENYGACPFQYFCRNILEISPPDDRSGGVLPKDRGTLVHSALEFFFKENAGRLEELLNLAGSDDKKQVFELANQAVDFAMGENIQITEGYNQNILSRFKSKARRWIVEVILQELEYLKNTTQRPEFFEESLKWSDFAIEGLSIMGVVDRIDSDAATFSILDYKTGSTENVEKKIEKGLHFQLPLYSIMAKPLVGNRSPAGMFLYAVRELGRKHGIVSKELSSHCVGKNKVSKNMFLEPERIEELIEHAVKTAESYVKKIFDGQFSGEPQISNCRRSCEFKDVCRFRE